MRARTGVPGDGTLVGRMFLSGGPAPGGLIPVVGGSVEASADGTRHAIPVDAHGRFADALAPGSYTLTGTTPTYNDGKSLCRASAHVVISSGKASTSKVLCAIR
jgi:hypothetical protein